MSLKINHHTRLITLLTLVFVVISIPLIYWPVLDHQFLHWDDYTYIYKNPYINYFDFDFVLWAFTTTYFSYWHPITWLSHGLDYALWGMDSGRHHMSNLLLYGVESLCVFWLTIMMLKITWQNSPAPPYCLLIQRYTAGLIATMLFIVHPQHVEVVAWVSERKELLSTFFILSTIIAYIQYAISQTRSWLFLSFLLFLLALMSKPMAVTIPVVLIVLDNYPLERINKINWLRVLVWEKLPFFLASSLVIIITIIAQQDAGSIKHFSLPVHIFNTFNNSIIYLFHWLWPFNLSAFYPFPKYIEQFNLVTLIPALLFIVISGFAIIQFRADRKYWLSIWMIYLITLSPVIGLVHSGPQAAADRYAHLTTIGFYLLIAAGIVKARQYLGKGARWGAVCGLLTIVGFLGWSSHHQTRIWYDDLSLWLSVVEKHPNRSSIVHNNLGNAYFSIGDYDQAESQYFAALVANPEYEKAYYNLYGIYKTRQQWSHALHIFTRLSQRYPKIALPHQMLGDIYALHGEADTAEIYYQRALQIDASLASAHFHLASLYLQKQRTTDAIQQLQKAISIIPYYVDALLLLANIYEEDGQLSHAVKLYWKSYRISPSYAPAYQGLIDCLIKIGLPDEAGIIMQQVSRLRDV